MGGAKSGRMSRLMAKMSASLIVRGFGFDNRVVGDAGDAGDAAGVELWDAVVVCGGAD